MSKAKTPTAKSAKQEEIRKFKAELKRVTEERNILEEAAVYFASKSKKGTRSYSHDSMFSFQVLVRP
ncbi:transposase [Pseudoalteromonas citrea]|uniref:Transposase n=2 Tax=Pseudoalteromonas citrea TaxID=43655 RepID=A0AAD4AIV5_9GAMM|nr:transposase [Pseudoalteromonas citrea]